MTRFVRNPDGAVHSVPDDFDYPRDADGNAIGEWSEATEDDASPELLGKRHDAQVAANELHDLGLADDPSLAPLGEEQGADETGDEENAPDGEQESEEAPA